IFTSPPHQPNLIIVLSLTHPPPTSTLFPYTTLFRSHIELTEVVRQQLESGILANATLLRQHIKQGLFEHFKFDNTIGHDLIRLRSEEHTSELQSRFDLVCRLLLEKKI